MVDEVISYLQCHSGKIYVDATLGGGGHAEEILKRTGPDGILIGIEWDEEALQEARKRLEPYGERVRIVRENFIYLLEVLKKEKIAEVDGILLDLGLSSIQLEKGERGFSFQKEGPLDMRMDQRAQTTAADLIDHLTFPELERMLREYGEEPWARRIAKAIVREREKQPIRTTQALRRVVLQAIPKRFRPKRIDPATKTFQAIRIKLNDELENLRKILDSGWQVLKKGGRIVILSFHSLEDRIVKEAFRKWEKEGVIKVITPKPIIPTREEQRENPRSRSAKLRCAERV